MSSGRRGPSDTPGTGRGGREERHPHRGYRAVRGLTGRAWRGARRLPSAEPAGLSLGRAVRRSGAAAALPGPGGACPAWPLWAPLRPGVSAGRPAVGKERGPGRAGLSPGAGLRGEAVRAQMPQPLSLRLLVGEQRGSIKRVQFLPCSAVPRCALRVAAECPRSRRSLRNECFPRFVCGILALQPSV